MTSDLHAKLTDATRTALEIIRRERAGDIRGMAVGLPPPDASQSPG